MNENIPTPEWSFAPEGASVLPKTETAPELTVMPLRKAVIRLAWPAIASMLFIMVFQLVDAWWVGRLGAQPFAGVSAAAFLVWAIESVATLVSTGVNAMVARFVGEGYPEKASRVVGQGVVMAVFMGLIFTMAGLATQRAVFLAMGLQPEVLPAAVAYFTIILAGLGLIFLAYTIDAAFRGMGDTRTPLKIIAVALTMNMVLDPFFIFGIGPFPRMGAAGAALATVLAHGFSVLWGVVLLQRRQVRMAFAEQSKEKMDPGLMWRIAKIGAPIAFSGVMFSVSYMFLTRIITRFGPEALAAIGLGHRIEGLSYFVAVGFSVAAGTLVGQNLGAAKPKRAERAAWMSILYISTILIFVSLLFYFAGERIVRFFIDDPGVVAEGAAYLKIIALFEVFLGFEIVFEGAFSGAGNSLPPMIVSVPLTWARIPLAIFLAHSMGLGSAGIWWAISTTTGLKGVLLALWFLRGKWKTHGV